jgi:hypothetical protein
LVSQRERFKIKTSSSRHLEVGSRISRTNAKCGHVTKYISNTDIATFERIDTAADKAKSRRSSRNYPSSMEPEVLLS